VPLTSIEDNPKMTSNINLKKVHFDDNPRDIILNCIHKSKSKFISKSSPNLRNISQIRHMGIIKDNNQKQIKIRTKASIKRLIINENFDQ
jgi:hypothetical protein